MRTAAAGLTVFLLASPALAQVGYWLPNGPGGTTYNNPQGSLSGTYYEHVLQRQADQLRWQRERGQQAAAAGTVQPAQPPSRDPSFRLGNAGVEAIHEVYVSATASKAWGMDRLGSVILEPGKRTMIALPAGQCVNDVRVVYRNGQAKERLGVDTCGLTDITVR